MLAAGDPDAPAVEYLCRAMDFGPLLIRVAHSASKKASPNVFTAPEPSVGRQVPLAGSLSAPFFADTKQLISDIWCDAGREDICEIPCTLELFKQLIYTR